MWAMPGGYRRIPVTAGRSAVIRFVYVRPHKSKGPGRDRTLFVSNVPHELDDATLREVWQKAYGPIASVSRTAASAGAPSSILIVFEQASSMSRALDSGGQVLELPIEGRCELPKLSRLQAFAELRDKALKAEANDFMAKFDAAQAAARAVEADTEGLPDADGFITVTRTNKRLKRTDDDAAAASHSEKRKKKPTELQDFYHFQKHERKREHLHRLRQRFEEDKQRIAAMKAQRRFRPE